MFPHKLTLTLIISIGFGSLHSVIAQKQKPPTGGRIAVVVDERLSALRETPELTGNLVRRLGRGRLVAVRSSIKTRDGVVFFQVNVTRRTRGWIQREAVVSASKVGDDERLLALIKSSVDFDRILRARIFLDLFLRSPRRAEVLMLLGDSAEHVAEKLTREGARRLPADPGDLEASYFLNYSGLDRYNRQHVRFVFDREEKRLHYDGAAWREVVRRYPGSIEANEAKKRLTQRSD